MTDPLPLSLLNDYLYCPRRAALKLVEGWREANEHTARGDIVHEHADLPGYEVAKGVTLLRALPVWSDRLGLSGKCDIVELSPHPASGHPLPSNGRGAGGERADLQSEISHLKSLKPVEFKLGRRRQWENDDAQLCAQALCLEEMFGIVIRNGAVFHADSKRRREVEFTAELRALTERAIAALHALLQESEVSNLKFEIPKVPPAVFKPACEECSLFDTCLPKATCAESRAKRLARQLFEI
jgi:CRISPR-associated exonuclease Cas4